MSPLNNEDGHQSSGDCPAFAQLPVLHTSSGLPVIEPIMVHRDSVADEFAIKVENVWKKYEKNQHVLKDFNMSVPKGSIYALLGSSGSGKTTILSCVVGRQTWDSGTISVLGSPPETNRCSNKDCRRIGYMPQELALQGRLTIKELLTLYGRLCGMDELHIMERLEFLQSFLQLPEEKIVVSNLSGGQQRRASLAVALLHLPDLIILDEPTVGLDPLLRQTIWEYLQDLAVTSSVTIVLTTHYVDEARRSNVIGLMRNGCIIAEESPQELMRQYDSPSLDQIVLLICKQDAKRKKSTPKLSFAGHSNSESPTSSPPHHPKKQALFSRKGKLAKLRGEKQVTDEENGNIRCLKFKNSKEEDTPAHLRHKNRPRHIAKSTSGKGLLGSQQSYQDGNSGGRTHDFPTFRRIGGLIWATYLIICRHPAFIPFTFISPVCTTALVQFVFGSDLHDLKFGYVIHDEPFTGSHVFGNASELLQEANCLQSKFSYLFLNKISSDSLTLIPFQNKTDALASVHRGDIWGFVNIPSNYTFYMQQRMLTRHFSDEETVNGTIIGIHLDMSSFLGSILVIEKLADAYQAYLHDLATLCGLPSEEFEMPIKYEKPIFGEMNGTYAEHVVPGLLVLLIFVLPLGAVCVFVMEERKGGCVDRMRVSGMASWDLIATHLVTQATFQVIQITLSTLVLVLGFSYVIKGPILLYVIVNACYCACGLAIGFFMGIACANELQALFIIFGIASFLLTFSGVFWPIEGLKFYWKAIAYCLPTPLVSRSFRSVVFRGSSYTHALVWPGLVVPLIWMGVFICLALIKLRRF